MKNKNKIENWKKFQIESTICSFTLGLFFEGFKQKECEDERCMAYVWVVGKWTVSSSLDE